MFIYICTRKVTDVSTYTQKKLTTREQMVTVAYTKILVNTVVKQGKRQPCLLRCAEGSITRKFTSIVLYSNIYGKMYKRKLKVLLGSGFLAPVIQLH